MAAVTRSMRMAALVAIGQAATTAMLFVVLAELPAQVHGALAARIAMGLALLAVAYCQATLLASWLTLGPGSSRARLGTTFVFALGMALLYAFGQALSLPLSAAADSSRVAALFDGALRWAVLPLLIAAPWGAVARRWKWRWLGQASPPGKPTQFSVRLALVSMVVAAAVLVGAQWLREHANDLWQALAPARRIGQAGRVLEVLVELLTSSSVLASACLSMAACSGPRINLGAIAGALVAAPCLGLLNAYVLSASDAASLALLAGGATCACVWMIATMLVLRAGGMRIDRPTPPPPLPPDHAWRR